MLVLHTIDAAVLLPSALTVGTSDISLPLSLDWGYCHCKIVPISVSGSSAVAVVVIPIHAAAISIVAINRIRQGFQY